MFSLIQIKIHPPSKNFPCSTHDLLWYSKMNRDKPWRRPIRFVKETAFVLLENRKKWSSLSEICGIKRDNVLGISDSLSRFCEIGFNRFLPAHREKTVNHAHHVRCLHGSRQSFFLNDKLERQRLFWLKNKKISGFSFKLKSAFLKRSVNSVKLG